jgi:hypothetical protein
MVASLRDRSGTKPVRASQLAPAVRRSLAALRIGIAAILISNATSLMAADNPAEIKAERSRLSLFKLPAILKRDKQPAARHRPASQDRFVARALQLLTEARKLEKSGAAEAALKLAKRAQSVLKTAEHTAGARWPVNEERPAQYISAMKRRTGVTGETKPSSVAARATASSNTTAKLASRLPGKLTTGSPAPLPSQAAAGKLVLDWGTRAPATGITLTAGTQTPQERAADPQRPDRSPPSDETGLLYHQLDQLETWTSIESRAGNGHLPTTSSSTISDKPQSSSQPPLIIPGLIDRPDGIDDQNVEPIPTGLTDSVTGSSTEAVTTTIPVVPNPSVRLPTISSSKTTSEHLKAAAAPPAGPRPTIYDQTPRLLTDPDLGASARSTAESANGEATIWQLATAQIVSTFLGIILAIAAFLLIRAAASRLFGTRLGVTFQFGSGTNSSVNANSNEESADVVPFSGQSSWPGQSASESQINEPNRAGRVANPEDFPFRVVGTSNGEDEHILEAQAHLEQDSAILQSVFEQNVNLLTTLDKNSGSAA